MIWITLRNGRAFGTPLALYSRLADAAPEALACVEFQPDRVVWPKLDQTIRLEEVLLARTTREFGNWQIRLKRRLIILFEALESALLRHRFSGICRTLGMSSWWGDNWPQGSLDTTQY